MTQGQIDHGGKLLSLLDEAKVELILVQATGDYINLSTAKIKLNGVIAEIENKLYPPNGDVEAIVLKNEGSDKQEVRE